MQSITGSVGAHGANSVSDVALVKAMLVKAPRASAGPHGGYLAAYNGTADQPLTDAVTAFQRDRGVRGAAGLIAPGDATWTALVRQVPADLQDMRILAGSRVVYLGATQQQRAASLASVAQAAFAAQFALKIRTLLERMYTDHGLTMVLAPKGGRRTFGEQQAIMDLSPAATHAGPGENNHNYGQAVDLGYTGLRWLHANGGVGVEQKPYLDGLKAEFAGQDAFFWTAYRTVGHAVGTFNGPAWDLDHQQNWSDHGTSMSRSLAHLLSLSGRMRWSASGGHPNQYSSDLGFGGATVPVGSASQIWKGQATVTAAQITRLRAAAAQRAHGGRPPAPNGRPGAPPMPGGGAVPGAGPAGGHPAQASAADVAAARAALQQTFHAADANWQSWTPEP